MDEQTPIANVIPLRSRHSGDTPGSEGADVSGALRSGWLTQGREALRLQEAAATLTGAAHVIPVAGGGAALHIALLAAAFNPGDQVLLPAIAPVGLATLVVLSGGHPVFCDVVSPGSPMLDPDDVRARITPDTRAIVVVHGGGHPADLARLRRLADEHQLWLIEDCTHALGARLDGRSVGTVGHLGAFALEHTPDGGGFIVCDDAGLAQRLFTLRSSVGRPDGVRFEDAASGTLANGYRIDEEAAAAGIDRLDQLATVIASRRALAEQVRERAREYGLTVAFPPGYLPGADPTYEVLAVLGATADDALDLAVKSHSLGIASTRPRPLHHTPPFNAHVPRVVLPHAEEYGSRALELTPTRRLIETPFFSR